MKNIEFLKVLTIYYCFVMNEIGNAWKNEIIIQELLKKDQSRDSDSLCNRAITQGF